MSELTLRLNERFYGDQEHPYKTYENTILRLLPSNAAVLDVGCGHTAPVIGKLAHHCRLALGADVTNFDPEKAHSDVCLMSTDLHAVCLKGRSLDMVISRSVLEHIKDPETMFREVCRILKPGGHFIFLTPNLYDYASIISKLIPNRFHSAIVKATEGRDEEDTFPTFYRANTAKDITRLASASDFHVKEISLLGQYPAYLMFNPFFYLIGAAYDRIVCSFDALAFLRGWILCVLVKE